MLEHLVEVGALLATKKYEIPGGMDRLVEAFVSRLHGHLRLAARVESLRLTAGGIEVAWRDQFGWHADEFAYAISAVPAPALLRVRATPDLISVALREALAGVRYESAAKTVVHCRRRVWEFDDGIAGGGSFTDTPIQQCWYPSDNARQMTEAEENAMQDGIAVSMINLRDDNVAEVSIPAGWTAKDRDIAAGPGAFVGAYMWGANAERFAALNNGERDALVTQSLEQLHPHIGNVIEDMEHVSWDQEEVPGGGAFAFFRPGEFSRYQQTLLRPCPDNNPRLFFAGEHLAVLHAWIQSGIQTAWNAVAGVAAA